jgi:hypothetical protein
VLWAIFIQLYATLMDHDIAGGFFFLPQTTIS